MRHAPQATGFAEHRTLALLGALAALALLSSACSGTAGSYVGESDSANPTTPGDPAPETTTTTAAPQPVSFLAFGDAADCRGRDASVEAVVEQYTDDILFVGDAAYPDGSADNFASCFSPLYGDDIDRFHAVPGDNDYKTPGATEFFNVFGNAAGAPGEGWFSFETNGWQIIGLNSNCDEVGGCGEDSAQYVFLKATLDAAPDLCRIALWQHPRFTSSPNYDGIGKLGPMYELLYNAKSDILLVGNSHHYERFARLSPDGSPSDDGIRNFTVGTGGAPLTDFAAEPLAGSEVRNSNSFGVLRLTLLPGEYSWEFLPATPESDLQDSGTSTCVSAES